MYKISYKEKIYQENHEILYREIDNRRTKLS